MKRTFVQFKKNQQRIGSSFLRRMRLTCPLIACVAVIASPTVRAGTVLKDSFASNPPSTKSFVDLTAADLAKPLQFVVTLKMRNLQELQERVGKGEVISESEMAAKYFPLDSDYQAVSNWLKSQGLTVQPKTAGGTSILVSGNIAQLQSALTVVFGKVNANGETFISASNAPTVPDTLAPAIQGFLGLQPEIRYYAHSAPTNTPPTSPSAAVPASPPASDVGTQGGGSSTTPQASNSYGGTGGYKIGDIQNVYNAANLNLNGTGQTIAIIIDDFPTQSDLNTFWQQNGLGNTAPSFVPVLVNGGPSQTQHSVDQLEATLDVSWASGIAPGATIRLYEVRDLGQESLYAAYQQVYNDAAAGKVNILSLSYGANEALYTSDGNNGVAQNALLYPSDNVQMTNIASRGVTIFVSSGDGGSRPAGPYNPAAPTAPETPASATNVVAVGGTTLNVQSGTDTIASETGWTIHSYPLYGNEVLGSGGGISGHGQTQNSGNSIGSWQKNYTGNYSQTARCVPDISLVADPYTPGSLAITGTYYNRSTGQQQGTWSSANLANGTSWATPTWAGFCARINQARANSGKQAALGGSLTSAFYTTLAPVGGLLRDITSGDPTAPPGGDVADYSVTSGYDLVTGLGVPNNLARIAHTLTAPFFTNESDVGNTYYYLTLPNGNLFGYYSANGPGYTFPLIYHQDMGFEYIFNAGDSGNGIYMYDYTTKHFFYTSQSFPFPYIYDFTLKTVLYYYPDPNKSQDYTTNPRYFYNFNTKSIITQ